MRIPRIYLPIPLAIEITVALSGNAFQRVVRVLRLKAGDPVVLFNGEGGEFRARLIAVEKRSATASIEAFVAREAESPLEIILAQGVSRGEHMDYTLQKAVELGVSAIAPLITERSVASLEGQRLDKRLLHWQGVVISACEQCGRNRLPSLLEPMKLSVWLANKPVQDLALVLAPHATRGLRDLLRSTSAITLLIGPEGGLSPTEIALTQERSFIGIRLGPRVLRTETAGVSALAALQVLWGDF